MNGERYKIYDIYAEKPEQQRYKINLILFLLTLCTTLLAGAFYEGADIVNRPDEILRGVPFALTLMGILMGHELGHYILSEYHNVTATLPYFIPAPVFPGTISVGTFGAFIKMKSPFTTSSTLLDIGVAGPLFGTILAIPVFAYGIATSRVMPVAALPEGYQSITLGSSLILYGVERIFAGEIPESSQIFLNSIGYAGWIGLFVTSLNLIPIGQLDGGHISYALFGRGWHRWISRFAFVLLFVLGFKGWTGWLVWAFLGLLIGFRHPQPVYPFEPLDRKRKILGIVGIILFVLSFIPEPIKLTLR